MFVTAFLLSIAFVPGLPSESVAPRWWVIWVGTPLLLSGVRNARLGLGGWLGLAFLLCCAVSMIISVAPLDTTFGLVQLFFLALAFVLGGATEDLKLVWLGFGLGAWINALIALAQHFGSMLFVPPGSFDPVVGLFSNRDLLAEFGLVTFFGLATMREGRWSYFLGLGALLCIALSGSRAGALAMLITAGYIATDKWRWPLKLGVLTILAAIPLTLFWQHWDISMQNRLDIWDWALSNMKLLGWGLGSYGAIFPVLHAHNEPIEWAFELGIGALPLGLLFAYALGGKPLAERSVLVAILTASLFGYPFHNGATQWITALVLGRLCAGRAAVVIERRRRGIDGLLGLFARWHPWATENLCSARNRSLDVPAGQHVAPGRTALSN